MHPNPASPSRRVHGAEFKAAVLAACRQPGASVAAVALAHGLNVNLVRKWLVGRGLKRAGLGVPREVAAVPAAPVEAVTGTAVATAATPPPPLRFVPVELAAVPGEAAEHGEVAFESSQPSEADADIHVELRRGVAQLVVRWPASQAVHCAAWLRELAATALK